MPTETGLRLFVDGIMQVAEPTVEERIAIELYPIEAHYSTNEARLLKNETRIKADPENRNIHPIGGV